MCRNHISRRFNNPATMFPHQLNSRLKSTQTYKKANQNYLSYESKVQTDHILTQEEDISLSL